MNNAKNKHYEKTHKQIKDSFTSLIFSNKKQISVTDICNACSINRSTFYAHFEDLDSLMDVVMFHLFSQITDYSDIQEIHDGSHPMSYDFILSVIKTIYENRKVFTYCVSNVSFYHMRKNTEILVSEILLPKIQEYLNISESELLYYYTFLSSGFLAVINHWIENGCTEPPEDIAQIIYQIMPQKNSLT